MPESDRKREEKEIDPAKLEQLLEIELMQKRTAWQQAKARRSGLRALSFFFLFVVLVAALLACFFLLSPDRRAMLLPSRPEPAQPTPSVDTTPP
jgi:hypothetical protein